MRASTESEPMQSEALTLEEIALLEVRAARYATTEETQATDVAEGVVFRRGDSRWAIPLSSLREVRPLRGFCKIPCASPAVPGILHFRGEILSLHDVRAYMDSTAEGQAPAWVIVVEHEGERIGLAADEILDIEAYSLGELSPLPVTLGERGAICEGMLRGGAVLLSPLSLFRTEGFFSAF